MIKQSPFQRLLGRVLPAGESLSAGVGLTFASTLVLTLATTAFFWLGAIRDTASTTEQRELRSLGMVISRTIEAMLNSGDVSSVRRLLMDLRAEHGLEIARLSLPDGAIIADADPSKIELPVLPDHWATGPIGTESTIETATPTYRYPISVAGRGSATLELSARTSAYASRRAEALTCFAVVAIASLLIHLLIYRRTRRRLMSLSLIRESLMSIGRGESIEPGDAIDPKMGEEAVAWNQLVVQSCRARHAAASDRAKTILEDRRESKLDLENAVDGLSVGFIVLDSNGKVRHANGAAAALLQRKRDAMIGSDITSAITDETVAAAIIAVLRGETMRQGVELRLPGATGESVLKVNVRPLRRGDDGGVLVCLDDITQQKSSDAARNNFVAQAAHELRSPLTNMRLCIEEAMESPSPSAETLSAHLNLMNTESRRLERIVGEMLTIAEIEAGSIQLRQTDLKLDRLLQDLITEFQTMARDKQLKFEIDLPPKYPSLVGDRDRLTLCLHNLLNNAMKYTPQAGLVRLEVKCEPKGLFISVKDSGIGISAENQARLFTRFFRASDPRVSKITGTGLGLALAREIARLHGGEITVESELDKGSTFRVRIPIVMPQAQAA